jgi:hypothetical protein
LKVATTNLTSTVSAFSVLSNPIPNKNPENAALTGVTSIATTFAKALIPASSSLSFDRVLNEMP